MPLLTVFADAFIALALRVLVYILPMLAGMIAATATKRIIETKKTSAKKRTVQRRSKALVQ